MKKIITLLIAVIIVLSLTACGTTHPSEDAAASASNSMQNVEEINAIVFDVDVDTYAYGPHSASSIRTYFAYVRTNDGTLIEVSDIDQDQYLELRNRLKYSDNVEVTLLAAWSSSEPKYEIIVPDEVHTIYTAHGYYYTNGIVTAEDGMVWRYADTNDRYDGMPVIVEIDDNGTPLDTKDDVIIDIYTDPTVL